MNTLAKKVVVLDDDDRIAKLVIEAVNQVGFTGESANNFESFKEILSRNQPDLILIDLVMPKVDGILVLRYLASQNCTSNILLMSGFDLKVVQTAERLGVSLGLSVEGVLSKPVPFSLLKSEIKRAASSNDSISETDLRTVVANQEIDVHLQPKVRLSPPPSAGNKLADNVLGVEIGGTTYEVVGFEALARWQLSDGSFVPPSIFIPMAEEIDLIQSLTETIYQNVVKLLGKWNRLGYHLTAAINISPRLMGNLDLPDLLVETAISEGVATEQIILELTESATMADADHIMEVLTRFRLKGFGLSIDDFGTGYSSLIQLYRMPFTEMKVDKSFVDDMKSSEEAQTIIRSIVNLGHNLGMKICAEGVEDLPVGMALAELTCDYAQGYYYSRPQRAADFEALLNIT